MRKFKNVFKMNDDLFVEQHIHVSLYWVMYSLVFAAIILFFATNVIMGAVATVAALVFALVVYHEQVSLRKKYIEQLAAHDNQHCQIDVEFLDSEVHLNTSYGDNVILPYSSLVKSKHRKNLIVIETDRGYYIPVKKDSFVVGSLSTFESTISIRGM